MGRDSASVHLIAVSKTKPASAIEEALAAGQIDFGENYVQEAVGKIETLAGRDAVWHFIGAIQTNKTRDLARCFDWVHTVSRAKVARRLDDQCPPGKRLNVCLQINVDGDPNKAGVAPEAAGALLQECLPCERLALRGLMTILDPRTDPQVGYNRLRELFEELAPQIPRIRESQAEWDTLSMGMSGDYLEAVAAGATYVRVGTAIFGPRTAKRTGNQE